MTMSVMKILTIDEVEVSKPKRVNSIYNIIGVNSFRLWGLQITCSMHQSMNIFKSKYWAKIIVDILQFQNLLFNEIIIFYSYSYLYSNSYSNSYLYSNSRLYFNSSTHHCCLLDAFSVVSPISLAPKSRLIASPMSNCWK